MGPRHTGTLPTAFLNTVIMEGAWCWPPITNMESVEITHSLPIIYGGEVRIVWTAPGGTFSPASAYAIFCPPGPTVGWSSLLLGTFKIPRHCFIFWLAILGKLSTLDKPWLRHMGSDCVLCPPATPSPMITFSLGASLLRPISVRSGGWFVFSGHILLGRHPSCGLRRDGKGNM
ncbi:UNVERIFIED_CONTAM: hypothetical protein Slati_0873700 [Sesamum latifolium]|uniref:Reverse transcriptase zinc-binding domain-containing protein n=1 Tax=Sesamum latifolium TaxID=2727402 RepID=A0AAW2XP50_9LAMI